MLELCPACHRKLAHEFIADEVSFRTTQSDEEHEPS